MMTRGDFVRSALDAGGMEEGGPPRPSRVMAFMKDGSSRLYASR